MVGDDLRRPPVLICILPRHEGDGGVPECLLAGRMCEGVDAICIEDLHLEAMTAHGGRRKKGTNRGMRFIRHGAIIRKVKNVAQRLGVRAIKVNPKHASQACYVCGYTDRENRKGEAFRCVSCGRVDNADSNEAANIIQRGTKTNVPAGGGTTLERREIGRTRKPPVLAHADPDRYGGQRPEWAREPSVQSTQNTKRREASVGMRMSCMSIQAYSSRNLMQKNLIGSVYRHLPC